MKFFTTKNSCLLLVKNIFRENLLFCIQLMHRRGNFAFKTLIFSCSDNLREKMPAGNFSDSFEVSISVISKL